MTKIPLKPKKWPKYSQNPKNKMTKIPQNPKNDQNTPENLKITKIPLKLKK